MFNALKYTKQLEGVGLTREQAEAHILIMTDVMESNLASSQDIKDLRTEMTQMEYRLVIKLGTIVTISMASLATIIATVIKFF